MAAINMLLAIRTDLGNESAKLGEEHAVLTAHHAELSLVERRLHALHHHLFPDDDLWKAVAEIMHARHRITMGLAQLGTARRLLGDYLDVLDACIRDLKGGRA